MASISSVQYDSRFVFLGLYVVKPEDRGRGFGVRVWKKAVEYQGSRNVGLDGVISRQADYEKYGFRFANKNFSFVDKHTQSIRSSKNIIDLADIQMSKIAVYDRQIFSGRSDKFISA